MHTSTRTRPRGLASARARGLSDEKNTNLFTPFLRKYNFVAGF